MIWDKSIMGRTMCVSVYLKPLFLGKGVGVVYILFNPASSTEQSLLGFLQRQLFNLQEHM